MSRLLNRAGTAAVEALEGRRLLSAGGASVLDSPPSAADGGHASAPFVVPEEGSLEAAGLDTRNGFTVVAGNTVSGGSNPTRTLALARVDHAGRLDRGFEGDGRLTRAGFTDVTDLLIQPDNKILVT